MRTRISSIHRLLTAFVFYENKKWKRRLLTDTEAKIGCSNEMENIKNTIQTRKKIDSILIGDERLLKKIKKKK